MKPALILDTSTERGVVALVAEGKLLFLAELPFGLQNSQFLLPELQRGLALTGISLPQLAYIGVGVGPGSYTGMRIGATVAKCFSLACQLPVIGVCSLHTFVPTHDTSFAALIDAKIGGVYLQRGESVASTVSYEQEPQVCPLSQAVELLRHIPYLITPNAVQLRPKMEALAPQVAWQWNESYPAPLRLAELAEEKYTRGEFSAEGQLELLYMRKPVV